MKRAIRGSPLIKSQFCDSVLCQRLLHRLDLVDLLLGEAAHHNLKDRIPLLDVKGHT
jgi:hypothetical protein